MAIRVNGKEAETGKPGTFAPLDRAWTEGDVIAFDLPMSPRAIRYDGTADAVAGHERYAYEYGPILLAFDLSAVASRASPLYACVRPPYNSAS